MTQAIDWLPVIYHFLDQIGIEWEETTLTTSTFLPGILIEKGKLKIDRAKLKYPGDLLHEAGHIAITATEDRTKLSGELAEVGSQGDELAAILWSYAAAVHIGLPVEVLFHADGYKGDSVWLQENFRQQNYIGLPYLQWLGMTLDKSAAQEKGIAPFPNMLKWLR